MPWWGWLAVGFVSGALAVLIPVAIGVNGFLKAWDRAWGYR